MSGRSIGDLPRSVLALGPIVVLAVTFAVLYITSPFGNLAGIDEASTLEIVWMLTVIGAIAGIIPVAIGMLWFPFIRDLDPRYLHAFMALAGGVLAFIALEMTDDAIDHAGAAENTLLAGGLVVLGVAATFGVMYAASKWRQRQMVTTEKSGLEIAYLVAIALGLHSIGEGLGIGTYFIQGESTQVMLLVLAFVMHNVMEGPTVVAAVARDHATPPLHHFAAMGVIAGGPVILGGWIGSFAQSDLLAALFFAIAIGAILQVLIEVAELIRFDAETVLTRVNAATFVTGFVLMFFLEDVLVDLLLEGWLLPV
ncbi:ZIP family metal transporter [Natrarchaeobius chitinivorans]|uniref:Metal cation transporter n=1 Tax=Natrarchaeobius chitinivorans TaxID=1679083 RepID=A0A3N6M4A0_NATCH|nr:metal cation transporter [Natrarchaeobius chitinivorans]RQG90780.1 metal cation transporter [Natrarchaeobius chitinivorans]